MKPFKVKPIFALLVLFGMAVMSSTVANAQTALIFSDDFESGSLAEADWRSVGGLPPVVQSAKSRAGGHALKSTLLFFNGAGASPTLRERVEVRALAPETEVGREYWYGFSIYLPGEQDGVDNYVADRYWEVVAQWQGVTDSPEEQGRNPALTVATSVQGNGGRWYVSGRSSASPINGKGDHDTSFSTDLGPYETGKWTDWVFRIKWSYRDDGILEVWKDGRQVISRVNAPIGYNDQTGPYFKMGIYKGSWESLPENGSELDVVDHRVIYHDEFRMADERGSYATVAPGGAAIVPTPPSALQLGN